MWTRQNEVRQAEEVLRRAAAAEGPSVRVSLRGAVVDEAAEDGAEDAKPMIVES
jgi:hypothetical protein